MRLPANAEQARHFATLERNWAIPLGLHRWSRPADPGATRLNDAAALNGGTQNRRLSGPRCAGATQRGPRPPGSIAGGRPCPPGRHRPEARREPVWASRVGKMTPAGQAAAPGWRINRSHNIAPNGTIVQSPAACESWRLLHAPAPWPLSASATRVRRSAPSAVPTGVQTASRSAADSPLRLACVRVSAGHRVAMIDREPARTEPGEPHGIVAIAASAGGIIALGHVRGRLSGAAGYPHLGGS
jgi:hypothetical protein